MKKKLLIIDDSPNIRKLITLAFSDKYDMLEAEDCASARRIISGGTPDLILLDFDLPDGDGVTFLKSARETGCVTPVIMLTAKDDLNVAGKAMDAGASGYVTKPFEMDKLAELIEERMRPASRDTYVPWRTE